MEHEKNDSQYIENKDEELLEDPKKSQAGKKFLLGFFDLIKTVVLIAVLTYAIRLFVIQPFIVEGQSMEPSFRNSDYLITEKISLRMRQIGRGEIVIFHPPENTEINYIKRVVGLPGDTINLKNGKVMLNGKQLGEPYLSSNDQTSSVGNQGFTATLKEGEYFVMGDNRSHSRDSRELGAIPLHNIVSRVWFRLLPINNVRAFAAVSYGQLP